MAFLRGERLLSGVAWCSLVAGIAAGCSERFTGFNSENGSPGEGGESAPGGVPGFDTGGSSGGGGRGGTGGTGNGGAGGEAGEDPAGSGGSTGGSTNGGVGGSSMGGRDNTGGKAGAAGTGGKGGTGGASGAGGGSGTGGAGGKSGAGGAGGRSGAGGTGGMDSKPTCGAWKDSGVATDGARVIDPDGTGPIRPFSVYCAGMASATPREYLDLPHNANAGFPGMNVSVYVDVMDDACPCGALELRFTKVRIRPADLVIVATDTTFATFNADATCLTSNEVCQGPLFVYATAMDCRGLSAVFGSAEVDFGETPFHIANSAAFAGVGWMPHGSVTYSSDRKRASLTGGGFCGGFTPSGGELPLTQD